MPRATANGIELEYETFGDAAGAPLLLIAGLGSQMISWDEEFCQTLASRGFRVIRFDNRDVGLSTWLEGAGVPALQDVVSGETRAPYQLEDMAGDAAGLLDALGIPAAHLVGASMGGYIAQLLAVGHPQRALSLTTIVSGPAPCEGFPAAPEGALVLLTAPAPTYEERVAQGIEIRRVLVGSGDPLDESYERRRCQRALDRAFYPAGTARQLMATLSASAWMARLNSVHIPALVVGGTDDILIPIENSRSIAAAIPGATLIEIQGMGHDLPRRVWARVADAIAELARQTTQC